MFKHIHIVACSPRSGTTLLHEVMVTCFKVDKHYDLEVRFNLVSADAGQILITKRPDDFLIIDLPNDDGWSRLCPFLGHDIPNEPFPHANKASWSRKLKNWFKK